MARQTAQVVDGVQAFATQQVHAQAAKGGDGPMPKNSPPEALILERIYTGALPLQGSPEGHGGVLKYILRILHTEWWSRRPAERYRMHVGKEDPHLVFQANRYGGSWFAHSSNERDAQFTKLDDTTLKGSRPPQS